MNNPRRVAGAGRGASLMVLFSFVGGAAVYRANVHIAVEDAAQRGRAAVRRVMLLGAWTHAWSRPRSSCSVYGIAAVRDHLAPDDGRVPGALGRLVYLPIPVGGLFTLLFIIERVWIGEPPRPRSCTATSRWRSCE